AVVSIAVFVKNAKTSMSQKSVTMLTYTPIYKNADGTYSVYKIHMNTKGEKVKPKG
ncbi:MAG: hypothetical protein ACI9C4_003062, partial [Paraglaciecola sp.]